MLRRAPAYLLFLIAAQTIFFASTAQAEEEFGIWQDQNGEYHIRKGTDKYHCCSCVRAASMEYDAVNKVYVFTGLDGNQFYSPVPRTRVYLSNEADGYWYCPPYHWEDGTIDACGLMDGTG